MFLPSYPNIWVSCWFFFMHEITSNTSNTGYHSKLKYSDIIYGASSSCAAAALLSSALGWPSLQIFPKYRYLKVKRNSILSSIWWSQEAPFLSRLKLYVTIRNTSRCIWMILWFCYSTGRTQIFSVFFTYDTYVLQSLTLGFKYFAEFSKKVMCLQEHS